MVYPYSDELLFYDKVLHRYVLTPKAVQLALNVNLVDRLNNRGASSAEDNASVVLSQISLEVYNFIYKHTSQWLYLQKVLAKAPSAREVIKQAMLQQVSYYLVNGQIDKFSGVDLRNGRAMDLRDLRGLASIDPQTEAILEQPLIETGVSLLYRGRYSIPPFKPNYVEEDY